ncbi:MAG: EAL domain-containing protein, partial [bacterium]
GTAVNYYSPELSSGVELRQYIIENLDRAMAERWIQVYYQPIVRAVNERVCDEEALARWIDPEQGFLNPGDFIPALEDAGLIYKLDLYVLDRILEKIKKQQGDGLHIMPHSLNLSRSDFDACDIVEEIRARVDAAGIPRDRITIEITESIIGSDFDFMKAQVQRFQSLGFPVWMDDFGSGYSSLDVLQSIKFDLLKFDMSFMRKLDEDESSKVILTELMKMATALDVDTVCEGVETEEQVRFLQEIGCSKLQGFYFCKPIPPEQILDRNRKGIQIGYENPEESAYYESMGRVNLYDLSVLASEDENAFQNAFSTVPMGIIEVRGDTSRFVRSNPSYRDFMKRFFNFDLSCKGAAFAPYDAAFMRNVVRTCCEQGSRAFYDEQMPDGAVVHSFARRIGINPINGNIAVAVAVLSVTEPDEGATYADIARALAADYYYIYMVDMETERFIEYSSSVGAEELAMERHGERFFAVVRQESDTRIHPEDREPFLAVFTKANIIKELDGQGVFMLTYRLIERGVPVYVNMKITRMRPGDSRIIIGISIVDSQMKQKAERDRVRKERDTLARVMALSEDYLSLYSVDPKTGRYIEYSASDEYETLGLPKDGTDFFRQGIEYAPRALHPDDLPAFLGAFNKENVLDTLRRNNVFKLQYRLVIHGRPRPVSLKIAPFTEEDGIKLVAGVRAWQERR